MVGATCIASGVCLFGLLCARWFDLPYVHYALYCFKDIYIVVLVEVFWSFANSVYPIKTARRVYGVFCASGAFGGMFGNHAIGEIARIYGTSTGLWIAVPILILLGGAGFMLAPYASVGAGVVVDKEKLSSSFAMLAKSRYVLLLVAVITVVQLAITLIDYQYYQIITASFPATDQRTGVIGDVYLAIDFASITLQLLTGVILTWLGVGRTLLGVPLILAASVATFMISPRFLTVAIAKVASKALDYSVFRAGKEILYIPLSYDEKTRGKAIVDMLTYRVAKGGASMALAGLELLGGVMLIAGTTLGIIAIWIALTIIIVRWYTKRVAQTQS